MKIFYNYLINMFTLVKISIFSIIVWSNFMNSCTHMLSHLISLTSDLLKIEVYLPLNKSFIVAK